MEGDYKPGKESKTIALLFTAVVVMVIAITIVLTK